MKSQLTDLMVKKLPFAETGQKTYWDVSTPGFGVRCSKRSKSFVVMYGPKRLLKTLGRYPGVSLADARKHAKRFQIEFVDQPEVVKKECMSFANAKEAFLAECVTKNRPRTVYDYTRILNRHFKFQKNVNEIDRREIMKVLGRLSSTPSEKSHAYVVIRIMMNWCVRQGLIEHNPVPVMKQHCKSRDRVLSNKELVEVFKHADEIGYPYGTIVQLLILTGQRRGEIAGLRRSWIGGDEIVFPASHTKNSREHRLPLTPRVSQILRGLPDLSDMFFLARTGNDRPFNGWGKCKERFDRCIGFSDYTLHDIRRTFSSNMARLGTPIHVTEKLLNHVSGSVSGVAAVYNRYSYADEMRSALIAYETEIEKMLAGHDG